MQAVALVHPEHLVLQAKLFIYYIILKYLFIKFTFNLPVHIPPLFQAVNLHAQVSIGSL